MPNKDKATIGVLALQGDFSKHVEMLCVLGVEVQEVRYPKDLEKCDGLIIPGGESSVIFKQIDFIGLKHPLKSFAENKPVFGTCAGLILISQKILSKDMPSSPIIPLGLLDISVERNAFGRQIDSFTTQLPASKVISNKLAVSAFFIRAPRIRDCGPEVNVLATYEGEAVLVQQGFHLGATFHPELTLDTSVHAYFLKLVQERMKINL